jgi:hypothetical protein
LLIPELLAKAFANERMRIEIPKPVDTVFNIGAASGTPVDDNDYQIPFTFTGKINKITYALDPPKLSPADIKKLEEATNNSEANK